MTLHENIEVTEARASVACPSVWICHVDGTNELAIVYKFNLLMVTLEELRDTSLKEVHTPVSKRIIPDADAACLLEFRHKSLIRVEVEVINDKVARDTAFGGVRHFLKGDACHHLVIHVVGADEHTMSRLVNFAPK